MSSYLEPHVRDTSQHMFRPSKFAFSLYLMHHIVTCIGYLLLSSLDQQDMVCSHRLAACTRCVLVVS